MKGDYKNDMGNKAARRELKYGGGKMSKRKMYQHGGKAMKDAMPKAKPC